MSREDKSVPPIDGRLLVSFFRVAAAQYTTWRKDLGGVVKSGYEGCNIDTALMVLIHLLPGVRRFMRKRRPSSTPSSTILPMPARSARVSCRT